PTLDQAIRTTEAQHRAAADRRRRAHQGIDRILAVVNREGREWLTPAEEQRADQLLGQRDEARRQMDAFASSLTELRAAHADEAVYQARARQVIPTPAADQAARPAYDRVARIGHEARTYHRGNDPAGRQFLMDVCRAMTLHDPDAVSRLARHMAEERAERQAAYFERAAGDTTTANWAGLTGPPYLTDMYAPGARAPPPVADAWH